MGGGKGVYHTSLKEQGTDFAERSLLSTNARHPQTANTSNGGVAIVWEEDVEVDSVLRKRIGFLTELDGVKQDAIFISPDSLDASYPVILGLPDSKVLIAWNQRGKKAYQVYYQLISH